MNPVIVSTFMRLERIRRHFFRPVSKDKTKVLKRRGRFKKCLALFLCLLLSHGQPVLSLPAGIEVQEGDVTYEQPNDQTLIINASDHAIINFDSFSIGANETVQFFQPLNSASLLSRVTGSLPSEILGSLFANGEFILINSNGIHFSETANINVGSLIASTLNIQNMDYLNNQLSFERMPGASLGAILNEANIMVTDGGHLVLLADSIKNTGTLTANLGSVILGVGEKAALSLDEHGLLNLVISEGVQAELEENKALIENTGELHASGGKVELNAKTFNDTMNVLINNEGIVEANMMIERDGVIEIVATGAVTIEGEVSAEGGQVSFAAIGDSTVGNLVEAENVSFNAQGENQASYTLAQDSEVNATGNIEIAEDTTVNAANADIHVEGDWNNQGTFNGDESTVEFAGSGTSQILGNTQFHNFTSITPEKVLEFEAGATQTIDGLFKIQGAYQEHVRLLSTEEGLQWKINPTGEIDISYGWVMDSINLNGQDIIMIESTNRGNSIAWDPTLYWKGAAGANWSDGANWDNGGGAAPGAGDDAIFDDDCTGAGFTCTNNNSTIDASYAGSLGSLTINSGYTQTITMARSLATTTASARTGNITINDGILAQGANTLTVGGTFTMNGGTFTGGSSAISMQTFDLNAGAFTSTSDTLTVSSANVDFAGTGTFSANGGTFEMSLGGNDQTFAPNGATFNNFTIHKTSNGGGATLTISNDFTVGGTLTMENVDQGADDYLYIYPSGTRTVTVNGNISIPSNTPDDLQIGNTAAITDLTFNLSGATSSFSYAEASSQFNSVLKYSGSGTQTFSNSGGGTFYGNIIVDKASGTMQLSTALTTGGFYSGGDFTLTQGTFDINSKAITIGDSTNGGDFTYTNGTISNLGTSFTVGGTYRQDAGTLAFGTTTTSLGAIDLNGGTLTAPSGTLTITGTGIDFTGTGTWDDNNSTVKIANPSGTTPTVALRANSKTFNNLTWNPNGSIAMTVYDNFTIDGTFSAENLAVLGTSTMSASGSPTITLNGNYSATQSAGGGLTIGGSGLTFALAGATSSFAQSGSANSFSGVLNYTGSGTQTFNQAGGSYTGSIIVNKGSGTMQLSSNLSMTGTTGDFTLTNGAFDWNSNTVTVADDFNFNGGTMSNTSGAFTVGGLYTQNGASTSYTAGAAVIALDGINMSNGTLNASSATSLTIADEGFTLSGGTFTAPSATLYTGSTTNLTGGTFDDNNGTFVLRANTSYNFTSAGNTFYNFGFDNSSGGGTTVTLIDDFTIDNNMTIFNNSNSYTVSPSGTRAITVNGNVGTYGGNGNSINFGSSSLSFNLAGATSSFSQTNSNLTFAANMTYSGSGAQTYTQSSGSHSGGVTINKSSGTMTMASNMTIATSASNTSGDITMTQGTWDWAGYNVTVTDDFTYTNGTLSNATGSLTVGDVFRQDAGSFTQGSLTMSVGGAFDLNGGTFTATSGTLTVGGDLDFTGTGNFVHNSGTIVIDNTGTFTPNSAAFYNLTFRDDDGILTIANDFSAAGTLSFALDNSGNGDEFYITPSGARVITVTGNVSMPAYGVGERGDLFVGDSNLTMNLSGATSSLTQAGGQFSGNLKFSGTGTQVLTSTGEVFNGNIEVDKASGEAQLGATLTHTAASKLLTITNGTFDINGYNLVYSGGAPTFSNLGTFRLQGGETVTNITNDTNSGTVEYDGTSSYLTALAMGSNYYSLNFSGSGGIWEPSGTVTVGAGATGATLTIGSNAIFDVDGQNLTMSNSASFSNSGTLRLTGAETFTTFTNDVDSGTVEYDGSGTYTTLAAGNSYYNLKTTGAGSWRHASTLNVDGDLTIQSGTLDSNGQSVTLAGSWSNSGSYTSGSNTVTFDGQSSGTLVTGGTGTGNDFNNLTIAKTGGASVTLTTNDLDVDGTLTLTSGTLAQGSLAMTVATELEQNGGIFTGGNAAITVGTLDLNSGTFTSTSNTLTTSGTTDFTGGSFTHNSGTVTALLTSSWAFNPASATFYNLNINKTSGSTATLNVDGSATVANDLNIQNNTNVDLTIDTDDDADRTFTVQGNMTLPSTASTGGLDIDPGCNGSFTYDLTGNNSSFTMADSGVTVAADTTLKFSGSGSGTQQYTQSAGSFLGSINVDKTGGSMQLQTALNITGTTGDFTLTQGTFDWNSQNISVGDNFTYTAGTMSNTSGTFDVDGIYAQAGGSYTAPVITLDFGGFNLSSGTFNAGSATSMSVGSEDFTMSGGTMTAPSGNLSVTSTTNFTGGAAGFNHNSGTFVLLADVKDFTFTPAGAVFNDLTFNKTTAGSSLHDITVAGNLSTADDLTIVNNTANDYDILVSGTPTLTVGGDLLISNTSGSAGTIDIGSSSLTFDLNTTTGSFTLADAEVDFDSVLKFSSTGNQTFTHSAGDFDGSLTIDKSSGTATLAQALTIGGTFGDFTLTQGTFDWAGYGITVPDDFTYTAGTMSNATAALTVGGTYSQAGGSFTASAVAYNLDGFNLSNGTFNASSAASMTITDENFTVSGGTFTAPTGTLTVGSNINLTGGTYTHNSGTLLTTANSGSILLTSGGNSLYDLTVSKTSGSSSEFGFDDGTTTIAGDLVMQNSDDSTLTVGGQDDEDPIVSIQGNMSLPSTAGTGEVSIDDGGCNGTLRFDLEGNTSSFTMADAEADFEAGATVRFESSGGGTQTFTQSAGDFLGDIQVFTSGGSIAQLGSNLTGTRGSAQALSIGTGVFDLNGYDIVYSTASTLSVVNGATFRLDGNETITNLANDTNSGTVEYAGTGSYTTSLAMGNSYHNLNFSGSGGVWEPNGTVTVGAAATGATLTIGSGAIFDIDGQNLTFSNSAAFSNTGTLRMTGSETLTSFTNDTDSGTITYDGTSSYLTSLSAGNTYYSLSFTGSGGVWEPNGAVRVGAGTSGATLSISSGATFDIDGQNLTMANSASFSNEGTLRLSGSETFTSFTNDTDSGLVEYDGSGTYSSLRAGNSYYQLTVSGSGSFTAASATDVNSIFTQSAGTFTAPSSTMNVGDDFLITGGTFTHNSGEVILDSTTSAIVDAPSGGLTFWDFTINAPGKTVLFSASDTFTIASPNTWTVTGSSGNLITLGRSGGSGTDQWSVNAAGTDISYVNVSNSNNTTLTYINPSNSTDGGNNLFWFESVGGADPGPGVIPDPIPPEIPDPEPEPEPEPSPDPEGDPTDNEDPGDDSPGSNGNPTDNNPGQPGTGGDDPAGTSDGENESGDDGGGYVTYVFVEEGAVNVGGDLVYDGETITVGKDGKGSLSMRAVYVTNVDGVLVFRAKSHQVLKKFHWQEGPSELKAASNGQQVYAVMRDSKKISVLETSNLQRTDEIYGLGQGASYMALSPDNKVGYVVNSYEDRIQVVNLETKEIVKTIRTGSMPTQITITKDGAFLFVTNWLDKTVSKLSTKTGATVARVEAGKSPYGLALSKDDQDLYVTDSMSGKILVFGSENFSPKGEISVGDSPSFIKVDEEGKRLFVSNRSSHSISIVDIAEQKEIAQIKVGKRPAEIALTPEGNRAYVANELSGNVSFVDLDNGQVIQNIKAGTAPRHITLSAPPVSSSQK